MALLPLDDAVARFSSNEDKINTFVHGNATASYNTSEGDPVPSISKIVATLSANKFPDGSLAAPGIGFANDPDLGFRRSSLDEISLVTAGQDRLLVSAARMQLNSDLMQINGPATGSAIIGSRSGSNAWFLGDQASAVGTGAGLTAWVYGDNPFRVYTNGVLRIKSDNVGTSIYTRVGINTSSPQTDLHVVGDSTLTGSLNVGTNKLSVSGAGNVLIGTSDSASGGTAITSKLKVDFSNVEPKALSLFSSATNDPDTPVGGLRFSWFGSNNASIQMLRRGSANDGAGLSFHTSTSSNVSTEVERMRLTSNGNLLIGNTSDTGGRLRVGVSSGANTSSTGIHIAGTSDFGGSSGNAGMYLTTTYGGGVENSAFFRVKRGTASAYNGAEIATSNTPFRVLTSLTEDVEERMRITPTGNMGLDTIPSPWSGTNTKGLDISMWTGLANGDSFGTALTFNTYFDGTTWRYKKANFASRYEQSGGVHRWYSAGTGTPNAGATFDTELTLSATALTASGEVVANEGFRVPNQKFFSSGSFGRFWGNAGLAIGQAQFAGLYGSTITYNAKIVNGAWQSIGGGTATAMTMDEGIFSVSQSQSVGADGVPLTWTTSMLVTPAKAEFKGFLHADGGGVSWAPGGYQGAVLSRVGNDAYITTHYDVSSLTIGAGATERNRIEVFAGSHSEGSKFAFKLNGTNMMEIVPTQARVYTRLVASGSVGNQYNQASIEVNGGMTTATKPSLGFHQPGFYAGTLRMDDNVQFGFYQIDGTSPADLSIRNVTTSGGRFLNDGVMGVSEANARNHFKQFNVGSGALTTGWVAAAFGDTTGNRVVIGQGEGAAIVGAHTGDLNAWSALTFGAEQFSWSSNGQSNGNKMLLNSDGNLLVGTTDAFSGATALKSKLKVNFSNNESKEFSIFSSANNTSNTPVGGLRFSWYGSNNASIQMVRGGGASDGAGLSFHTSSSSSINDEVERMRITNTGIVDINSDANAKGLIVRALGVTSSQVNIGVGFLTTGRPFVGTNTSSNPLEVGTRASVPLLFVTNGVERAILSEVDGTFQARGRIVSGYGYSADTGNNVTVVGAGTNSPAMPYFVTNNRGVVGTTGTNYNAGGLLMAAYRDVQSTAYLGGVTLDVENTLNGASTLGRRLVFRVGSSSSGGESFASSGVAALPVERMALTSQGNLSIDHHNSTVSGVGYATFTFGGTTIGSITQSGTTAVTYNTTSDYRLKTNIRDANASRFMEIRFRDYERVDGRHECGVIAHELQEIYPELVTGEKDDVEIREIEIEPAVTENQLVSDATDAVYDDEGNILVPAKEAVYENVTITPAVVESKSFPKYQQVNYQGLIPRMGTIIQQQQRLIDELTAKLEALTARVEALE